MKYFFILFFNINVFAQQAVFLPATEIQRQYYIETNTWFDGSPMNNEKVDGFIYKKKGSLFYVLDDYAKGNAINAKLFGVKANGISDDTTSLQKSLDLGVKYGITLILPYGTMITSNDLLLDISSSKGKIRLIGSGISNTIIKNIGTTTKNALKITGNHFNNLEIRDFRIERELSTPQPTGNVGLFVEKQVYASLENIEIIRFTKGIVMQDVSSLYMKAINARYCGQGFYFGRGLNGDSNPNLIEMHSCRLTSNSDWGITIVNGHSINIYSSLFESNGKGGINFTYDGINGANSINLNGSYFEGNEGVDLYLKASAGGTHNIIGNTFNRVDSKHFTTNNIIFEVSKGNKEQPKTFLNMIGNGFMVANSYHSEQSRKAVSIVAKDYGNIKVNDSNFYQSPVETPNYHKDINLRK